MTTRYLEGHAVHDYDPNERILVTKYEGVTSIHLDSSQSVTVPLLVTDKEGKQTHRPGL